MCLWGPLHLNHTHISEACSSKENMMLTANRGWRSRLVCRCLRVWGEQSWKISIREAHEQWTLFDSASLVSNVCQVWAGKRAVDSWTVGMAARRLHLWFSTCVRKNKLFLSRQEENRVTDILKRQQKIIRRDDSALSLGKNFNIKAYGRNILPQNISQIQYSYDDDIWLWYIIKYNSIENSMKACSLKITWKD